MNTTENTETPELHRADTECPCCGSHFQVTDVDGSRAYVHNA